MFLDANASHDKKDIDEAIKGVQDRGTSTFLGTIRKQTKFIDSVLAAINKLQQITPKNSGEYKNASQQYKNMLLQLGWDEEIVNQEDPYSNNGVEFFVNPTDWMDIKMDIQKA